MGKRTLTLLLDESAITYLRKEARKRGLTARRGPGAPGKRGNIGELLEQLAEEDKDLGKPLGTVYSLFNPTPEEIERLKADLLEKYAPNNSRVQVVYPGVA